MTPTPAVHHEWSMRSLIRKLIKRQQQYRPTVSRPPLPRQVQRENGDPLQVIIVQRAKWMIEWMNEWVEQFEYKPSFFQDEMCRFSHSCMTLDYEKTHHFVWDVMTQYVDYWLWHRPNTHTLHFIMIMNVHKCLQTPQQHLHKSSSHARQWSSSKDDFLWDRITVAIVSRTVR